VLSLSIDFYVRIFARVYTSPEKVKEAATKQMYVYQSVGCDSFYTQRIARKVTPVLTSCSVSEEQNASYVSSGMLNSCHACSGVSWQTCHA
jgi:tRNA G26 N,N-dimethylase Trm1